MIDLATFEKYVYFNSDGSIVWESMLSKLPGVNVKRLLACAEDNIHSRIDGEESIDYEAALAEYNKQEADNDSTR